MLTASSLKWNSKAAPDLEVGILIWIPMSYETCACLVTPSWLFLHFKSSQARNPSVLISELQ